MQYPKEIQNRLNKIAPLINKKSIKYKTFHCDNCSCNFYKMYHVWTTMKSKNVEIHLCRKCATSIGVSKFG